MMADRRDTAVLMKCSDSGMSLSTTVSARLPARLDVRQGGAEVLEGESQFLAETLEVDERRTQVVRDAVDEHLVFLLALPERPRHVAENGVQPRDLVAAPVSGCVNSFLSPSRRTFSVNWPNRPTMSCAKIIATANANATDSPRPPPITQFSLPRGTVQAPCVLHRAALPLEECRRVCSATESRSAPHRRVVEAILRFLEAPGRR